MSALYFVITSARKLSSARKTSAHHAIESDADLRRYPIPIRNLRYLPHSTASQRGSSNATFVSMPGVDRRLAAKRDN